MASESNTDDAQTAARDEEADGSGKASLLSLDYDILVLIAEILCDQEPKHAAAFSQVCWPLYNLIERCRYRSLVVDLNDGALDATHKRLSRLRDLQIAASVQRMQICSLPFTPLRDDRGKAVFEWYWRYYDRRAEVIRVLCDLMPQMGGLRDMSFDVGSIAPRLMKVLVARPRVRVHLAARLGYADYALRLPDTLPRDIKVLSDIAVNLRSVTFEMDCMYGTDCVKTLDAVRKLLLASPHVTCVSLNLGHKNLQRQIDEYMGLGFAAGEKLPALEELSLLGYPFGRRWQPPTSWQTSSHYRCYTGSGYEMDYWARAFDWTRLKVLRTDNAALAARLAPLLIALESVDLENVEQSADVEKFMADVASPLKSIRNLRDRPSLIDQIVIYHSSTLQELSITCKAQYWRWDATDAEKLHKICSGCPQLVKLKLDFFLEPCTKENLLEQVENVMCLPSLQELQLWLPLTESESDISALTLSAAEAAFVKIRNGIGNHCPKFRRLELHSANRTQDSQTTRLQRDWRASQQTTLISTLSDNLEDALQGSCTTTCSHIERARHGLNRHSSLRDYMDSATLDEEARATYEAAYRLASEGPLPYAQFAATHEFRFNSWQPPAGRRRRRRKNGMLCMLSIFALATADHIYHAPRSLAAKASSMTERVFGAGSKQRR